MYYRLYYVKPSPKTILGTYRRFQENEPIIPKLGGPRDKTVLTWNKEDEILDHFYENKQESLRSAIDTLGVSKMSISRVLNGENWYPYHYQKVQELVDDTDYVKRVQFCQRFIAKNNETEHFLKRILWSDECLFTREGMFNSRNYHLRDEQNPYATRQAKFQHRWSVNVWCGLLDNELVSTSHRKL